MVGHTLTDASLKASLALELAADAEFLPRQPIDDAAIEDLASAEKWLKSEVHRLDVRPSPVVAVHKWRYGRRPVPALPLQYRVPYRSVVRDMSERLWRDRADGDHEEFAKAPVLADVKFVVSTDLSNYYSTIHIDTLMRELLAVTGDWDRLNWLDTFLKGLAGRPYGIPQGSDTSDKLADTFAELLADALRRRGIQTWRFADDFRLGCDDHQSALRALEVFDEETRKMGLYVNERKTEILSLSDYATKTESKRKALTEAWEEARESLEVTDIYRNIVVSSPTRQEVDIQAAEQELDAWWIDNLFESNPKDARIDLTVLLAILGQAGNPSAVEKVENIIAVHPEAGRAVATYLSKISGVDFDVAMKGLAGCLKEPLTTWHELWLVDVVLRGGKPAAWSDYPEDVRRWLMSKVGDRSVISAPATLALARHEAVPSWTLDGLFADPDAYSLPYLVAATAKMGDSGYKTLSNSRMLESFVTSWATTAL